MKDNRLTEIVKSLPASIPFVSPEEHERSVRQLFAARIGANENCYGPSPKVLEAIKNVSCDVWKYPDPTAYDLKNELAKFYNISDQNIIVGEGIDALLGYLVRLFIQVGDNVVTSNGSYPTFNYHVEGFGGQIFKCDYRDDKEDLQLLIDKASKNKAKLLYFSNPNNPMGTWMRGDTIVSLLEKLPDDCLLILDEAYAEFAPNEAKVPILVDDPRLIRFRTFSKAYGIAGARIGYGLGSRELIGEFDKIRNHFGNSLLSQVAAIAAIKDQKYLSDVVKKISLGREKIYQIAKLNGLTAIPSATNFVAIDCGKDGNFATQVMNGLLEAKIFVRKPAVAPLDRTIRVTVGRDDDIELFKNVFPQVLKASQ